MPQEKFTFLQRLIEEPIRSQIRENVQEIEALYSSLSAQHNFSAVNLRTYNILSPSDQFLIRKEVKGLLKQMQNLQTRNSDLSVISDKIAQLKATAIALVELDTETIELAKKQHRKFNTPDSISTSRTSLLFQNVGLTQTATANAVKGCNTLINEIRRKYSLNHEILTKSEIDRSVFLKVQNL